MAIRNQSLNINFRCLDITSAPATGIAGEASYLVLQIIKDGAGPSPVTNIPSEPSATGLPGIYELLLTNTEMDANFITVGGMCKTPQRLVEPTYIITDKNYFQMISGDITTVSGLVDNITGDVTSALNSYDPPTRAELTTDINSILSDIRIVSGNLNTVSGIVDGMETELTTEIDVNEVKLNTLQTSVQTISGHINVISGYISSGNLNILDDTLNTVSGIVRGIRNQTDYLPSGLIDTVSHSGVLAALLSMANGKFIKTGDSYAFYKQNNAAVQYTLNITDTTRTRS